MPLPRWRRHLAFAVHKAGISPLRPLITGREKYELLTVVYFIAVQLLLRVSVSDMHAATLGAGEVSIVS